MNPSLEELSCKNLERDKFGIPILPSDKIKQNIDKTLTAQIYVFCSIEPKKEKYLKVTYRNISTNRRIPGFTYSKPDPQGKDPRKIENISIIDEKTLEKIRTEYVLLGFLPFKNCSYKEIWGMRNHLHKPATVENPGMICAVFDKDNGTWSTRTYFELDSIERIDGKDTETLLEMFK
jgi:hypothetical protein